MKIYETCKVCKEVHVTNVRPGRPTESYKTTMDECGWCEVERLRLKAAEEFAERTME